MRAMVEYPAHLSAWGADPMHRRNYSKSMAATAAIAATGRRAPAVAKGCRTVEVIHHISMKEPGAPVRLWVPVPQDALDYQRVVDLRCGVGGGFSGANRFHGGDGPGYSAGDRDHRPGSDPRSFRPLPGRVARGIG